MRLSDILLRFEALAPLRYAETWDNVGLLVGDPAQAVHKLLLTNDYTALVADEAQEGGCDLVFSYHPPLFKPLKHLRPPSVIFEAARRGVAIYSPHTALDAAPGGTNDVLAEALGCVDITPLRVAVGQDTQHKLVTFVPEAALDKVAAALFAAGAGHIGRYRACSFRTPGTGTFFGAADTHPTVGQSGRLETAPEVRLETVLPVGKVTQVVQALRDSHPYEEPAFDLTRLAAPPESVGMGRIGRLDNVPRATLVTRLKEALGTSNLLIAGPQDGVVARAAVVAGAGGDFLRDAIRAGAQLFVTGEMRHHDALYAASRGITVIMTLHSNSERLTLQRVAKTLQAQLSVPIVTSQVDRDPFTFC